MKNTSTGLDKNVASGLCYVLCWISGLVFFLLEKEDQDVRFHAMQSIIVFGGLNILNILLSISLIGLPLVPLVMIVWVVLWVLLIIKGFQGEHYKLPYVGDLAEKWAAQIKA
ncbi:DUF4870 domain-containing protein [Paremcibacter congregatus]|uniref:DUF4870 domain-containing protein n=1 Tax=Paremcibacter congregatus TaxID=2043170 RepID=A0A2G4YTZ1_9PROT|nr:DUF4870 domain-containing protein [Paremcibacter congregatus]PHZ85700.1 hypothetical protein CRD36_03160 [Paremcibacter congregatus]QDE26661.1 hypothetical protein FIV45_04920 [Paremcibacter congregatus]|tara:strand:- start:1335 stop:1670 length:336 start_codon:yes stop_codon:yes gene_type:complete